MRGRRADGGSPSASAISIDVHELLQEVWVLIACLADSSGLGYAGGALVISSTMVLILAAHYLTRIPATLLFWMAFVLTRPLGATVGDFFSKPHDKGGLNLGTVGSSATLAAILLILIGYTLRTQRKLTQRPVPALEGI